MTVVATLIYAKTTTKKPYKFATKNTAIERNAKNHQWPEQTMCGQKT